MPSLSVSISLGQTAKSASLGTKRRRRSSETSANSSDGHAKIGSGRRRGGGRRRKGRKKPNGLELRDASAGLDNVAITSHENSSSETDQLAAVAIRGGRSDGAGAAPARVATSKLKSRSRQVQQVRHQQEGENSHDFHHHRHTHSQLHLHDRPFSRSHTRSQSQPYNADGSNKPTADELDHPLQKTPPTSSSISPGTDRPAKSASSTSTTSLESMEPPVLSLWGPDPIPLPQRFAKIKKGLIAGHEAELEASWGRLIVALRSEVDHIEGLGAHLIPSVEFNDLKDPAQTARFGRDLRRYGVGVVRKVIPRQEVDSAVRDTVRYLDGRRRGYGGGQTEPEPTTGNQEHRTSLLPQFRAPVQDPTCFDCFWTPAQVRCRAHANVLHTQRFMMSLWEVQEDGRLETRLPITYVDRLRVHGGGFDASTSGTGTPKLPNTTSSTPGLNFAWPRSQPSPREPQQQLQSQLLASQSADDWITALQSAAGIIAQVDNGSLERWEPDGYGRSQTYDKVFHGRWEDYEPWECTGRASSTMDLYNGYGACTIFRMFQGLLALSTIEPGMLRLLPSPKLATAYYLLRPFFAPKTPAPERRSGAEWDAYLDASNWELQHEPDTTIHGAVPGHAQRLTERWHPHLYLRSSLVTLPTLQPGDYIFWHPDLPYHISSNSGQGLHTPSTPGADDISMLVYIPAAPLTQTNALYLARQRKAFQRGQPGPDFDSSGRGTVAEDTNVMPGEKEIAELGGASALRAMGLQPWVPDDEEDTPEARKNLVSKVAASSAENEVVRIANLILFPD